MSQENCSQEKRFKASDDLYLFNNVQQNMPRQSKRRSSILKTIDANLGNFGNEERRQSRRVSFANNLFLQELKPDGTTQMITEPFKNLSDDQFDNYNLQNDSTELRPPVIRSEKRRKSSKSLRSYLSSHYNMQDDNDYTTVLNTSVNRTNAKRKFEEMQKKDLSTLFCDDDMDLTKLDANKDNSKFTFNKSAFSSSDMNLTFCTNKENNFYPVPKGFVASSTSTKNTRIYNSQDDMELTDLELNRENKINTQSNSEMSLTNLTTASTYFPNTTMNITSPLSQRQNPANISQDSSIVRFPTRNPKLNNLTLLSIPNDQTCRSEMDITNLSKTLPQDQTNDDMELTDMELNRETEISGNSFLDKMSIANLSSSHELNTTNIINYVNSSSSQKQTSSSDSKNSDDDQESSVRLPVKNPELNNVSAFNNQENDELRVIASSGTNQLAKSAHGIRHVSTYNDQENITFNKTISNNPSNIDSSQATEMDSSQNATKEVKTQMFSSVNMDLTSMNGEEKTTHFTTASNNEVVENQTEIVYQKTKNTSVYSSPVDMELTDMDLNRDTEVTNQLRSEMHHTNLSLSTSVSSATINTTTDLLSQQTDVSKLPAKNPELNNIVSSTNDQTMTSEMEITNSTSNNHTAEIVVSNDVRTQMFTSAEMDLTNMNDENTRLQTFTTEDAVQSALAENKTILSQLSSIVEPPIENSEKISADSTIVSSPKCVKLNSIESFESSLHSINKFKNDSLLPASNLIVDDKPSTPQVKNCQNNAQVFANKTVPIDASLNFQNAEQLVECVVEKSMINHLNFTNIDQLSQKYDSANEKEKFVDEETELKEEEKLPVVAENDANSSVVDMELTDMELHEVTEVADQSITTIVFSKKIDDSICTNATRLISPKCVKLDPNKLIRSSSFSTSKRFNSNAWALSKDKLHSALKHKNQSFLQESDFAFNNELRTPQVKNHRNTQVFVNKTMPIDLSLNVQKEKTILLDGCVAQKSIVKNRANKTVVRIDEIDSVEKCLSIVDDNFKMNDETKLNGPTDDSALDIRTQRFSSVYMDLTSLNGEVEAVNLTGMTKFTSTNNEMTEDHATESPISTSTNQSDYNEALRMNESFSKPQNLSVNILIDSIINNLGQNEKLSSQPFALQITPSIEETQFSDEKMEETKLDAVNFQSSKDVTAMRINDAEVELPQNEQSIVEYSSKFVEKANLDCDLVDRSIVDARQSIKINNTVNKTFDKSCDESIEILMRAKDASLFGLEISRNHLSIKESTNFELKFDKEVGELNESEDRLEKFEISKINTPVCKDQPQSNSKVDHVIDEMNNDVEESKTIGEQLTANEAKKQLNLPQKSSTYLSPDSSHLNQLTMNVSSKKPINSTFVIQPKELVNEETVNDSSLKFRSTFVIQVKRTADANEALKNTFIVQSKKDDKQITVEDEKQIIVEDDKQITVVGDKQITVEDDKQIIVEDDKQAVFEDDKQIIVEDDKQAVFEDDKQIIVEDDKQAVFEDDKQIIVEDDKQAVFEDDKQIIVEDDKQAVFEDDKQITVEAEKQITVEDEKQIIVEIEKQITVVGDKQIIVEDDKQIIVEDDKQAVFEDDKQAVFEDENLMNVDLVSPTKEHNSIRRPSICNHLSSIERELKDTLNDSIMAFQTQTYFSAGNTRSNSNTPSINGSLLLNDNQPSNNEIVESNFTNYKKSELEQQIEQAKRLMLEKSFFTDFVKDAMMYEEDKIKNYFSQQNRNMINLRSFNNCITLALDLENQSEDEYSNIRDMSLVYDFEKPALKFWADKFYLFYTSRVEHRNFIEILEHILNKQFDQLKAELLTKYATTEFLMNIEQEVELMLERVSDFARDIKITTLKFNDYEFKIKQDDTFDFTIHLFGLNNKLSVILNIAFGSLSVKPRFNCWIEEKKLYPFDEIKKTIVDELNKAIKLKINLAVICANGLLRRLRNAHLEQTVRTAIANWNID